MALVGAEELGFAASATDTGSVVDPHFTATGTLTLPIVLRGLEAFGISVPPGAQLVVTLGPGNPVSIDANLVGFDLNIVNPFKNFSLNTLLQLGEQILGA